MRPLFGFWNFVLIINLQRVYCVPHTWKNSLFVCLEEVWELIVSTLPQRLGDRGGVSLYCPMKIGGKVRTPGTPRWDGRLRDFVASYCIKPRTIVDVLFGCASGNPNYLNLKDCSNCVHHAYKRAAPTYYLSSARNKFVFDLWCKLDTQTDGWLQEVNCVTMWVNSDLGEVLKCGMEWERKRRELCDAKRKDAHLFARKNPRGIYTG